MLYGVTSGEDRKQRLIAETRVPRSAFAVFRTEEQLRDFLEGCHAPADVIAEASRQLKGRML